MPGAGCAKIFVGQVTGRLAITAGLGRLPGVPVPASALIITRLSRSARSLRSPLDVAEEFSERCIDLVALRQAIGSVTPAGLLAFRAAGL